ncbi:TPA: hypothetical protein ACNH9R_005034, partial [Serratia marcescens]
HGVVAASLPFNRPLLIIIHHPAATRPTRGLYGTDCAQECQRVFAAADAGGKRTGRESLAP